MAEEIKFSGFTAADPATLEAAGGVVPSAVAGIGNNKSTWTQIKNWISNPLLALINNMVDKTKPMLQIMIGGLRSVYFSARWFEMDIEDSQPTSVKGAMWYGSDDNLPVVNLDYGVTGALLDDVITPATNKTGAVIPNGTVCYVSGSQGNRAVVSLAQAVLTPTTQIAIVVATHNVANNALGYFVNRGLVNQLNTSSYTEGQILWVSTTAGQLTGTTPAKPYSQIAVGVVTRVHATVGQIRVFPFPIPRLGQLTDVDPTGIVTGQALRLNSSGVFEPYTPLELGETASTAYRGDRGKVAYDHSQLITDNPHNVTVPQISGLQGQLDGKLNVGDSYTKAETTASNVINTPSGNISSTNVQSALNELDNEKAPALVRVQNKQSGGAARYKVADYSVACNAQAGGYFVIRVASHDTWETNGFCDVMFKFRVLDSTFTYAHQVVGGSPDIGGGMQWRYTTDGIRYYFAMSYYTSNSGIWSTILDNQMSSSGSVVNTAYNITDAGGTSIPYLAKTPDGSSNTTEIATTSWVRQKLVPSSIGANITSSTTITPVDGELRIIQKPSATLTVTITNTPIIGTISYIGVKFSAGCTIGGFWLNYTDLTGTSASELLGRASGGSTSEFGLYVARLIKGNAGWMIDR